MQINDIIGGIEVSREAEERHARSVIGSMKGTVRPRLAHRITVIVLVTAAMLFSLCYLMLSPGILSMLAVLVGFVGGFGLLWYVLSWELKFDGDTGWLSFYSLLTGRNTFSAGEIENIWIKTITLGGGRHVRHTIDLLCIRIEGKEIRMTLRTYYGDNPRRMGDYEGGCTNAGKLWEYLDLYRRFVSEEDMMIHYAGDEAGLIYGEKTQPGTLGMQIGDLIKKRKKEESDVLLDFQAIAAAAAAAKQETAPEPAPAAEVPAPEPIPAAEAPVPEPAPAAKDPKPDVDVDALFNQVLREHGQQSRPRKKPARKRGFLRPKQEEIAVSPAVQMAVDAQKAAHPEAKKPAPPADAAKKPDVDVDALFNQVLREHGKLK